MKQAKKPPPSLTNSGRGIEISTAANTATWLTQAAVTIFRTY